MTYWDSSALVTLFVEQARSEYYLGKVKQEPRILTAWHAVSECASAFCRLRREDYLTEGEVQELLARLQCQATHWFIVTPGDRLERLTLRMLRMHPLRAMDAIHLATACLVRGEEDIQMPFHTEDIRLKEAALKEGFVAEIQSK